MSEICAFIIGSFVHAGLITFLSYKKLRVIRILHIREWVGHQKLRSKPFV